MQESVLEEKANVLIVDDDPTVIQLLVEYLQHSFQLSIAKSRDKALNLLNKKDFDLVLLDVNLPDGNGIEICREIKESREYSESLAIIFMTSHYSTELEAEGLTIGASDYIYKPVNQGVLLARINLALSQIRKTKLLAQLANVDALTEIGNRRAFDRQLKQEWFRAKRESKPLSLLTADIDFFKQYNDTYGHPAGDQCLRKVALSLVSQFKRNSDFCFRIGGEEFAVILYDTQYTTAKKLAQSLLESIHKQNIPHRGSQISDRLSLSIGICDSVDTPNDFDALVQRSDDLLYEAKKCGRNQIKTPDTD